MAYGYGDYSNRFGSYGFGYGNDSNNYSTTAARYGLNVSDYYEIGPDGSRVFNYTKFREDINKKSNNNESSVANRANETDSFTPSTVQADEQKTKEVETEKETITDEYETAHTNFFTEMSIATDADQQSKELEKAWAEIQDQAFDLTKKGVSNATVMAGASEFIRDLKDVVAMTEAAVAEGNTTTTEVQSVDEQDNENSNLFANNPFYTTAFETSEDEEEEKVAA